MKREIAVFGTGGLGRECMYLLQENNEIQNQYYIIGFVDDDLEKQGAIINGFPVIGTKGDLLNRTKPLDVVLGLGSPKSRQRIYEILKTNPNLSFPNVFAKSVDCHWPSLEVGIGNIVFWSGVLTTNITLGNFTHLGAHVTLGHDVILGDYTTVSHGCNISGNTTIGTLCDIGTGTTTIQQVSISNNITVGAGTVVVRNLSEVGTYVGIPAKRIK